MGINAENSKIHTIPAASKFVFLDRASLREKSIGRIIAIGRSNNVPLVSFNVVVRNRQVPAIRVIFKDILLARCNPTITAIEQIIVIESMDDISSVPVITSPVNKPLY